MDRGREGRLIMFLLECKQSFSNDVAPLLKKSFLEMLMGCC